MAQAVPLPAQCQGGISTAGTPGSKPTTTIDLIFDSIYSGAVGGAAVALFFLVVDLLDGRPLHTPAMMGSLLLYGGVPGDVVAVTFDAVAYFTLAHMAAFVALGGAITWLVHEVELHSKHPAVMLFVFFTIIEVGFFLLVPLLMPGMVRELGIGRVIAANLLAAGAMAVFFVLTRRTGAWHKFKMSGPDFVFDSAYAGTLGGAAVALFFVGVDVLDGQPLFTPALMGSVLFLGVAAEDVVGVRLDAVAYYSLVHMVTFVSLGAMVTWLVHEAELHSRHPAVVLLVVFVIIEAGFLAGASYALPGVIARVGIVPIGIANLLAAGSIAGLLVWSHQPGRRAAEEITTDDGLR
jgi:hypothetical protein